MPAGTAGQQLGASGGSSARTAATAHPDRKSTGAIHGIGTPRSVGPSAPAGSHGPAAIRSEAVVLDIAVTDLHTARFSEVDTVLSRWRVVC